MLDIKRIIYKVTVGESVRLSDRLKESYHSYDFSSDAYMTEMMQKVEEDNGLITEAYKRDMANSLITDDDDSRDQVYDDFYTLVKGYCVIPDPTIKEAAQLVFGKLDNYGLELKRQKVNEETSMIDSLFIDLSHADVVAAIALLPGVETLVSDLHTAQQKLKDDQSEYAKVKIDNKVAENATDIKIRFIKLVNSELILYLKAMCNAKPEVYMDFAMEVASFISEANSKVTSKSSQSEKE